MKAKILLSALLTFLFVNGKASFNSSSLIIDVAERHSQLYIIELDNGITYETEGDIRIDNLRIGNNGLRIFKRKYRGSRRNPRNFDDRLVYNGNINIPNNSVVHTQLVNRRLFINRVVRKKFRQPRGNSGFGMRPRAFQQLKRSVVREGFDRDRLELLRFASRNNNFSSRQVLELMELMSFDSYRLKFAKLAYRNTIDKENYFMVRDGLTFTSSRRKLTQFINGNSRQAPTPRRRGNRR